MRYLRRFNEELKPQTYRSAANTLDSWGHPTRASKLRDWSDIVQNKQELESHIRYINSLYKHEPFEISIYNSRWDSASRTKKYDEEPIYVGNFYINCVMANWLFKDMYNEEFKRGESDDLSLSLEVILFPVEEELQRFKDSGDFFSAETYDNSLLTSKIWIEVFKNRVLTDNGRCYIEAFNNDNIFFNSRSEATRFKNMFISGLSGQNEYGISKWGDLNLNKRLIKLIDSLGEGSGITTDDIPKIINNAKRLSVNQLYKS